ncbi:hypothetical protein EB796_000862 [Bugula neritina]|uniref:Major facilitator superfamily (MFS) profile domain-containing protein n=1 Tax=Bugula neritina TaxID=10212 RepID=A0A7J7KRR3_BUGNE|nr:hypothetical protein EB796_000862 [Bugula neritina]
MVANYNVDAILEKVGGLGKYQWLQVLLICSGPFISSCHLLAIVFHSILPDHRCKIPDYANDTYFPFNEVHNQSIYQWIPVDEDGALSSCKIYNSSNGIMNNQTADFCKEYVFDKSVHTGVTLIEEFGMFCDQLWISTAVKVASTSGLLVGSLTMGPLADRYGRRLTIIGAYFTAGIAGVLASFSLNYYMFAALRFIITSCLVGALVISHIMVMEITGPSLRVYAVAVQSLFWPSGVVFTSVLAYYVQDWNWFQLIISIIPIAVGFSFIVFLKETPHFLIINGQIEEAEALFKHIASKNGKHTVERFIEEVKEESNTPKTDKLRVILQAPVLFKRTLLLFYLWFVVGLSYYGLSFNVSNHAGSIYVNNVILSGLPDLPSIVFVLLSQRLGRKCITIFNLSLGAISLISSSFLIVYMDLTKYYYVIIIVSMLGKLGISAVFTFAYFWSMEIYPTTLRSTLIGLSSLAARIGTLLSPVIVDLNLHVETVFGPGLAALVFGIAMLLGAFSSYFLPETNKKKIPETIEEANMFMAKGQYQNIL